MTLSDLTMRVGGELTGDGDRIVRGMAPLEDAGADEVAFLANVKYERQMANTRAAAVIVSRDYAGLGASLIRCDDAYFAFREAMVAFYGFRRPDFEGVDPRSNVHPSAKLGEGVRIAAFATVSAGCSIGAGSVLYPGVYVGPGSRVGEGCTLYANVALYDGTRLGDRVTIHAGTSVGEDGFGYATRGGVHHKIPQAGWVEIGDDVEIGACCAIDRAAMGPTVIGAGTKFSNLVAIGHGTKMGKGCLMVAQAGLAGSVTVGNYCVFAGQAGVAGHVKLGDGVRVGAKSGVSSDVPAGTEVLGSPAMPIAHARRAIMSLTHLPEMRTALRKVIRQVQALSRRAGAAPDGPAGDNDE